MDTTVKLWNQADGTIVAAFRPQIPVHDVTMVVFSPNDKILASVVKSDVYLWDLSDFVK